MGAEGCKIEVFKLFGSLSLDKDKFSSDLKGAEGEAQGFGGKMQGIFTAIGTYVVAAFAVKKVLDFVKESLVAFADFEAKTTKMFATMDPLPDDVKAKVIADIKEISEQYHILATDVVDAFDLAGDLGVPVDELKAFMGPAAELARVLGIDLSSSAGALAKTIQALGGDFTKTAEIADLFFKVAETGDADVNTLQVTFSKLLPVAQELGIGMDELAAYIATVAQQGVQTRSAVSGIQAVFEELSDSTKGVGLAFKAITGQSFPEFIKGGGTLAQALDIVANSSGETQGAITSLSDTTSDAAKVFAAISGKTFPEFIASGGKIEDAMKIAEGGIGKTAKAFDDLQLSNSAVSKAVTDFVSRGGSMETALKTIASKSVDASKAFDDLYDSNSEVSKAFEALSGKTFPEFIKQGGTLEQALALVGKATESVGGSADAAKVPLTQMFTSIEAGKIVLNTTGEKAALLKTNLDSMATAAGGAATALSKAWLDMSQTSEEKSKAMQVAVNSFQITFGGMADSILKPLNTAASGVLTSIMGLLTSVTSLLTGDFKSAWDGLKGFFSGLYNGIIAVFNLAGIGSAIDSGLKAASTAVVTFFTQVVPKWGTTITDGIKAGLASGWTSVVDWFKGAWDGLIATLTSWMPGFLKKWLGLGEDSGAQYTEGLTGAAPDVAGASEDLVTSAVDAADAQAAELVSTFGDMVTGAVAAIAAGAPEAAAAGTTLTDALAEGMNADLPSLEGSMIDAGTALTDGLSMGIDAGLPNLETTIGDVGTFTQDAFEDTFGIQSPAEMTQEIGQEISAGLALGIEDGKGDVEDSVRGLADDLRDAWGQIKEDAKGSTETMVDRLVSLYADLKSRITDTLGELGNNIVDYFRDQREAAQDHADTLLEIEQGSVDDLAALQDDLLTTKEDALTDYNRRVQDIQTDHNRALADLAADDADGRAEIENNYREDMEDAATDYARTRTDIETDYTRNMQEQEQQREDALKDEQAAYEENKRTLWEVIKETVRNFLTGLREELMLKAAAALVEAVALTFMLNPLAAGYYAAAAGYGAGALGLAIAGFEEGAVFDEPTLLPEHVVGEGRYSEAYIPLSPRVFSEIGQGIVNAMSAPAAPQMAAAGAGFGGVQVDMRGLFDGATFTVRDDQDATRIAQATYDLWRTRTRGMTKL